MTRLICTAPAPAAAGPISRSNRRTSGVKRGRDTRSRMPPDRQARTSQASWSAPDTVTAIAWLRAVSSGSAL